MKRQDITEWEDQLIEQTSKSLNDVAEITGVEKRTELCSFIGKLLIEATDGDRREMNAIVEILQLQVKKLDRTVIYGED